MTNPTRTDIKFLNINASNAQLYHNVPTTMAPGALDLLSNITQGAGTNQRIGDQIRLRHYRARVLLNTKDVRPNVTYRFSLVASTNEAGSDTIAELFAVEPGGGCKITNFFEDSRCLVLYDKVVAQTGPLAGIPTTGKERSQYFDVDIPLNQTVVWATSAAGPVLLRTLLFPILTAYDAYGTLTIDNIASFQVSSRLTFVDP